MSDNNDRSSESFQGSEPLSEPLSEPKREKGGRRRFLKTTAIAAGSLPVAPLASAQLGKELTGMADPKPTLLPDVVPAIKGFAELGKTGLKISDISFGSSRLRTGEERLVEHAIERGVNYIDTAESYTNGQSEAVIGNALKGKRDKVILASKQFAKASTSRDAMMHELEASLKRLGTEHIEVYFNHAVNSKSRLDNPEWYEFTSRAKEQGKIAYTGISGHAGRLTEVLDYAIDNDLVDVILAAYNFGQDPAFYERLTKSFDFVQVQPELPRLLAKAKAKNIGVVAMKTLMGARLNDMRALESEGNTFAQAAFRWTLSNPHVDALIVSMTGVEQIDEYLGASGAQSVADSDMRLLKEYAHLNGASYCKHACNSCEGSCPFGVPIADVLRTRMYATDYKDVAFAKAEYGLLAGDASPCLSCSGEPCAGACPHGIDIASFCAPTHRLLA